MGTTLVHNERKEPNTYQPTQIRSWIKCFVRNGGSIKDIDLGKTDL